MQDSWPSHLACLSNNICNPQRAYPFLTDSRTTVYLFLLLISLLVVLGLHCCAGFSPVVESGGCSLVVVQGLLIVVVSPVMERGL